MSQPLRNLNSNFLDCKMQELQSSDLDPHLTLRILREMTDYFVSLYQSGQYDKKLFLKSDNFSYNKEVLIKERIKNFELCASYVVFEQEALTPPHFHPEFVVDTIVNGALKEYELDLQNGQCTLSNVKLRQKGSWSEIHCLKGQPHLVECLTNETIVVSTSFGQRPQSLIDERAARWSEILGRESICFSYPNVFINSNEVNKGIICE